MILFRMSPILYVKLQNNTYADCSQRLMPLPIQIPKPTTKTIPEVLKFNVPCGTWYHNMI